LELGGVYSFDDPENTHSVISPKVIVLLHFNIIELPFIALPATQDRKYAQISIDRNAYHPGEKQPRSCGGKFISGIDFVLLRDSHQRYASLSCSFV